MRLIDVDKLLIQVDKFKMNSSLLVNPVDIEEIIENQPTAEPQQVCGEWIETKDELPEPNNRVLVFRPCSVDGDTGGVSVQWGWTCKRKEVSHWMPLPEPPLCGADMRNEVK